MNQARTTWNKDRGTMDAGAADEARDLELRTLDDFELMLAGGGESGPNWP